MKSRPCGFVVLPVFFFSWKRRSHLFEIKHPNNSQIMKTERRAPQNESDPFLIPNEKHMLGESVGICV